MSAGGEHTDEPGKRQRSVSFENTFGFSRLLEFVESRAITKPEATENRYIKARIGSQVKARQMGIKKLTPNDIPVDVLIDFEKRIITITDAVDFPMNYEEKKLMRENLERQAQFLKSYAEISTFNPDQE